MKTFTSLMCTLFDSWYWLLQEYEPFHGWIILTKGLPRSVQPTKCFLYSRKTRRSNTITLVYYKFSRFYGRPFRRDTRHLPRRVKLKEGRREIKCGAIEFSNAPAARGNDDNQVSVHHLCILCVLLSLSPSFLLYMSPISSIVCNYSQILLYCEVWILFLWVLIIKNFDKNINTI